MLAVDREREQAAGSCEAQHSALLSLGRHVEAGTGRVLNERFVMHQRLNQRWHEALRRFRLDVDFFKGKPENRTLFVQDRASQCLRRPCKLTSY